MTGRPAAPCYHPLDLMNLSMSRIAAPLLCLLAFLPAVLLTALLYVLNTCRGTIATL